MKKYLDYLYFPGMILVIAGLVAGQVGGKWTPVTTGLLIAGGILLLFWLLLWLNSHRDFWGKRSTQVGTNAFVSTLAVIAILGVINFLAVRYPVRADFTENQRFTLSPQTKQTLAQLAQPAKVWLFTNDQKQADRDLLENYRRQGDKFSFEYVDPQIQINLMERFQVQSPGEIHLEYGEQTQLVQTLGFGQSLTEEKLTNAIEKIQQDQEASIYVLQGHGEPELSAVEGGISEATTALENKGFQVQPLNLAQVAEIPADAAAIAVIGPKQPLFTGEVSALQQYVDQGGRLLLLLDPGVATGLEPLLESWGVKLDEHTLIDASGAGSLIGLGPATTLIANYGSHPITQDFVNSIGVFPLARPVGTVAVEQVDAVSLLITGDRGWAESDLSTEQLTFDPDQDLEGPFDLGVALTRNKLTEESKESSPEAASPVTEENDAAAQENTVVSEADTENEPSDSGATSGEEANDAETSDAEASDAEASDAEASGEVTEEDLDVQAETPPQPRLVVIGNSTFVTNGWFQRQINGDIFLNSMTWLAGEDDQALSIRPKDPENRRINLAAWQASSIGWLALFFVPLSGLIVAGMMWWRRR